MIRNKIRNLAIAGSALLIVIFLGLAFHSYQGYAKSQKELKLASNNLDALRVEVENLKNSLELYEKEKKEFSSLLFNEQDIPSFIDGISEFAKKTSINILDMKTRKFQQVVVPAEIAEAKSTLVKNKEQNKSNAMATQAELDQIITLSEMPIQIRIEGEYASFIKFLGYLEEFKQLLTVSNVEIAAGQEYPFLRCEFTLNIYSLKTLEELSYK